MSQNPWILVAMLEDLINYLAGFSAGGSAPASVLWLMLSSMGKDFTGQIVAATLGHSSVYGRYSAGSIYRVDNCLFWWLY